MPNWPATKQDDLGIFQQRLKIRHGADADKNQQRKDFGEYAIVVKKSQKPFVPHHVRQRDIHEYSTKADRHEEQGLVTFVDSQVKKQ